MRESIFSAELHKILHEVEKQCYTPKNPGDSRKLGSNTRQHMGHRGSVQEARIENFDTQVMNRNRIIREKAVNHLIGVLPAVLGLSVKIIFSQVDCSQLSDSGEHSSHCFQHLLPSLQGTAVFILKGQGLHDHQLTGSACDFQNAILSSKYNIIVKFDQDFIDLEEILNFLPRKNKFTDTKYNQVGCQSGNYFCQSCLLLSML